METELTVYESHPLTAKDIQDQVALIQSVMRSSMKDGEHYGKIPGCGDKPALLKPGAEKLNLLFRMAPRFEIETIDLGGAHREYRIKCSIESINTGRFLGEGVGSASTMEGKWRFRTGPSEWTGKPVPKEYWDLRKTEPAKAQDLLGGKGFQPRKNDMGMWEIARQGEKVEHDNPADYYNTCLKMAKKRAHVDAVLTVTAASDIFTQDIEEMTEVLGVGAEKKEPIQEPKKKEPALPTTDTLSVVAPIINVLQKPGETNGKKWTLYTIICKIDKKDIRFTTFSDTIGGAALKSKGTPALFEIHYKDKGSQYPGEIVENGLISVEPPEDADAQT
jgi:hypothetical protein